MTKAPRVSIVIPMFNVEKYIETCIGSILAQTFKDFEIIVVDDCSTDRSCEIVSKYTDPRIKLVRQIKNSGENKSRNLGLKIANGKYVYFMDSDDAILPHIIETLFNAAEESQADVVYMNRWFNTNYWNFTLPARIKIETDIISRYFRTFIVKSYRGELSIETINSILSEIANADPNLTRVLINAFATQLVKGVNK